jgi:hypothetical protein
MEFYSTNPTHPSPDREVQFLRELKEYRSNKVRLQVIDICQISPKSVKKMGNKSSTENLIRSIDQINQYIDRRKNEDEFIVPETLSLLKNLQEFAESKLTKEKAKTLKKSPEEIKILELAIRTLADKILEIDQASVSEQSGKIVDPTSVSLEEPMPSSILPYQQNILNLKIEEKTSDLESLNDLLITISNHLNENFLSPEENKTENGITIFTKKELKSLDGLTKDLIKIKACYEKLIASDEGKKIFINQLNRIINNLAFIYFSYSQANLRNNMRILATTIESLQNLASSAASFDAAHPLYNIENVILDGIKQQTARQFGAYFTGFGGEHVKGGHLHADSRLLDGQEIIMLDFKVSFFTRNNIEYILKFVIENKFEEEANSDSLLITDQITVKIFTNKNEKFKYFHEFNEKGNYISTKGYTPKDKNKINDELRYVVIEFRNLGKITLCMDPEIGTLYDRIKIDLYKENLKGRNGLNEIAKMLSTIGLGTALIPQSQQEQERIKIFQLFKIFYPIEAIKYYTDEQYYQMSIEKLKIVISDSFPEMKEKFEEYLENNAMKKIEIFPGKNTWTIADFPDRLRSQGAWGLTCGLTGKGRYHVKEAAKTIALILKNGMLSSESRFNFGFFAKGASANADMASGGAAYTFFRLVNDNESTHDPSRYPWTDYLSCVHFLVKLEALQTGYYCLNDDYFGKKNLYSSSPPYTDPKLRGNLLLDCRKINEYWEVPVNGRVDPKNISGVFVNEGDKKELMEELTIALNELGIRVEKGMIILADREISLDDFIRVNNKFEKNMF